MAGNYCEKEVPKRGADTLASGVERERRDDVTPTGGGVPSQ